MKILNIGVLAHVDAGKTTLTEQFLYRAGITKQAGSVDYGNTLTDSMEIEQKRGISVKSAAISFTVDDLKVNLIDTPGHADFISEVEHSLSIMDAAILVISAVEGVQSQTKILMETLEGHQIPTILFLNKIDRVGADYKKVYDTIKTSLTENICEMNEVINEGTSAAEIKQMNPETAEWIETLALNDEELFNDFANDRTISNDRLIKELQRKTKKGLVYPLFTGSAAKGIGMKQLFSSLEAFSPVTFSSDLKANPLSGVVYKVMKNTSGTQDAFVRIFDGKIHIRDEAPVTSQDGEYSKVKLKHLQCLKDGKQLSVDSIEAGDMAVLSETALKVGDVIGTPSEKTDFFTFHNPPMQVQISAKHSEDRTLHLALTDLTSEDPFLQYVQDPNTKENIIHIFGEIQQEILAETLKTQYGIEVSFSSPIVICKEQPISIGEAVEHMDRKKNLFWGTVGFRVEPGDEGSGLQYRLAVELGSLPLSFQKAIKETVMEVLQEGLYGWNVTDIIVTLTHTAYESAITTAKDFRGLVPLVLMNALKNAGTNVYEPVNAAHLTLPEFSLSKVLARLSVLGGSFEEPQFQKEVVHVNGVIPVRYSGLLESGLHSLTSGEGTMSVRPAGYIKIDNNIPKGKRKQPNPLNRTEYLLYLSKTM